MLQSPSGATPKQVRECVERKDVDALRKCLDTLKRFPVDVWHRCLETVLEWDSETDPSKREEAIRHLLAWGNEDLRFLLLEYATKTVGESETLAILGQGFNMLEQEGLAPGESGQHSEMQDSWKSMQSGTYEEKEQFILSQKELWRTNSGFAVAEALLQQFPQLATKVVSTTQRSIYHVAAQKNAPAVILLATNAAKGREQEVQEAASQKDNVNKNPIAWAARDGYATAIRTLFETIPQIEVTSEVLASCIAERRTEIIEILAHHRPALISSNILKAAIDLGDLEIWNCLFRHSEAWSRSQTEDFSRLLASSFLLHHAVKKRELKIVEELVHRSPMLATTLDAQNHSPLWYNQSLPAKERSKIQDGIRDLLAPAIIQCLKAPDDIRRLLAEDGKRKGIALDLSPGKTSPDIVLRFLKKIITDIQGSSDDAGSKSPITDLEFESTLRYVDIPVPDLALEYCRQCKNGSREEVKVILDWLSKKKNVRKIVDVRVQDSLYRPHSEEIIELALRRFNIDILDWKRTDLSVDCILEAAPDVQEIHLYSSGNWAPLGHWAGPEGVGRLKNLKKLQITVIQDHVGRMLAQAYADKARVRLENLKKLNGYKWTFDISPSHWDVEQPTLAELEHAENPSITPRNAARLEPFLEGYITLQEHIQRFPEDYAWILRSSSPRIKVAIIDTGIDETLLDFRNIDGASFVCRDGKESSWWLSQEMHGTNMARIIRSLDPYCELYIAQVGESKTDIRPERVIRALREAIDRGVDVISMSFCFDKSDNALNEIIHEAHFKDIVTFASTADEGYNAKEAWPAKSHGVNAIAACTANGIWTEYTTGTTVTFALQGDGLTLPALSGAPSRTLRGSSVATAMAAGLGSLILACLRMVDLRQQTQRPSRPRERDSGPHRRNDVEKVMTKMIDGNTTTKYVKPWTVFTTSAPGVKWRPGQAEHVMESIAAMFAQFTSE